MQHPEVQMRPVYCRCGAPAQGSFGGVPCCAHCGSTHEQTAALLKGRKAGRPLKFLPLEKARP